MLYTRRRKASAGSGGMVCLPNDQSSHMPAYYVPESLLHVGHVRASELREPRATAPRCALHHWAHRALPPSSRPPIHMVGPAPAPADALW